MLISGDFADTDTLYDFYRLTLSEHPVAVAFNSPGGNVMKAMELGRAIRAAGLWTFQIRGAECASACSLAFMGGVKRYAEPGSIGVHKSSFDNTTGMAVEDAVSAVQQITAQVIAYMGEMGVDPALLQLALSYDSNDIRYLSGSEMAQYRLTTVQDNQTDLSASSTSSPPQSAPAPVTPSAIAGPAAESVSLGIPVPKRGEVMHPKRAAPMRAAPGPNAPKKKEVPNGTPIRIDMVKGDWFKVYVGDETGYMHKTWVRVAEYEENSGEQRFIQVKSLDTYEAARSFAQAQPIPLDVHLASNSWFAITIRGTFSEIEAKAISKRLKADGSIPDDAMVTLGNTYVRKLCCE